MKRKRALITGLTGQDGSYLAEFLLEKDYEVFGMVRRSSTLSRPRIDPIFEAGGIRAKRLHLVYGDLQDMGSISRIVASVKPHEIYHLAAQSHVKVSFELPEYTSEATGMGTLRLLEAVRASGLKSRFYQASSSELYGRSSRTPQNEKTPFQPVSPYAVAKLFAYWTTVNYRESYRLFACNGILFNHESPRRGENFVTRKIAMAAAAIKYGMQDKLVLGCLDAKRDWGYAKDYVEAMWRMLNHDRPDDFVIATGHTHTVREFVEEAFAVAGLPWRKHVVIDKKYFRPIEVAALCGDASKARRILGWRPKTTFKALVKLMVDAEMEVLKKKQG